MVSNHNAITQDGIVARYLNEEDVEVFEMVYMPPSGSWIRNLTVDPFQPKLCVVGQESYTDSNDKRILLINVVTKKVTEVTDTSSDLGYNQLTFVR